MIVRYDHFDRLESPALTLCNPGSTVQLDENGQSQLNSCIGRIPYVQDLAFTFNFNAPSELTFSTSRPAGNSRPPYNISKQLAPKRYIYAGSYGFFQIQSVTRAREHTVWTYSVTATSCEVELMQTPLPLITDGIWCLQVPDKEDSSYPGILDKLIPYLADWSIGIIDPPLLKENNQKVLRHLAIEDNISIYDFLTGTLQEAFNCLVLFEPMQRVIHFRHPAIYRESNRTSIHLASSCLEDAIHVEESSENLYTAVYVTGGDDFGIRPANPMGTNMVYNFKPYYSWMPPDLCETVNRWQKRFDKLKENQLSVYNQFYDDMTSYYNDQYEVEKWTIIKGIYETLQQQLNTILNLDTETEAQKASRLKEAIKAANAKLPQDNKLPDNQSLENYMKLLNEKIAESEQMIKAHTTSMPITMDKRQKMVSLSPENLDETSIFTSDLLQKLSCFLYEGEYNDEYIAITPDMQYSDRLSQYEAMMDRAQQFLETASKPSVKFDVDVESFLFSKYFQQYAAQLQTGCSISVETDDDLFETLYLTAFDVNFSDKSLHLTFGNAYEKFDIQSVFDNVFPKKLFQSA